jgi:hypothetical protein
VRERETHCHAERREAEGDGRIEDDKAGHQALN